MDNNNIYGVVGVIMLMFVIVMGIFTLGWDLGKEDLEREIMKDIRGEGIYQSRKGVWEITGKIKIIDIKGKGK